jgi:hypothetical protein
MQVPDWSNTGVLVARAMFDVARELVECVFPLLKHLHLDLGSSLLPWLSIADPTSSCLLNSVLSARLFWRDDTTHNLESTIANNQSGLCLRLLAGPGWASKARVINLHTVR